MKKSHKRVLDALKRGSRLAKAGTIHGTYNVIPKGSRFLATGFQVHHDTIEEMRTLGLLVLDHSGPSATLVAAEKPAINWNRIFELRCKSKRGLELSRQEMAECEAAYKADEQQYAAMNSKVFSATVPFGSMAGR